jgi:nucleoid DNA-binding protein
LNRLSAADLPPRIVQVRWKETALVTKKEIVKTISEDLGLTQLKTKEIVQKTFDAIVATLVTERRIELRNFGVFEVKKRAPRRARNPRTGAKVFVPEKYVVTFKPGKEMEEKVQELLRKQASSRAARAKRKVPRPADEPEPVGAGVMGNGDILGDSGEP